MYRNTMSKEKQSIDFVDKDNKTPVHWAAQLGDIDCLDALLDHETRRHGSTSVALLDAALVLAVIHFRSECAELLLMHGANANAVDHKGRTCLLLVAQAKKANNSSLRTISVLLKYGANVDAVDGARGNSALMLSAINFNKVRRRVKPYTEE